MSNNNNNNNNDNSNNNCSCSTSESCFDNISNISYNEVVDRGDILVRSVEDARNCLINEYKHEPQIQKKKLYSFDQHIETPTFLTKINQTIEPYVNHDKTNINKKNECCSKKWFV
jgi:hypothetical protein